MRLIGGTDTGVTREDEGGRPSTTVSDWLSAALFALFILGVAGLALALPERNWDLAPYVAISIEDRFDNVEALHAATWEVIEQNTSEGEFAALTSEGDYRRAQFASPENFVSQLPMYRVKVGYVALVKALSPAVGPVAATQVINAASVVLIGAFLLVGMWRRGMLQGSFILAAIMAVSGFLSMARNATPDTLAAVFIVGGTLLLWSRFPWAAVPAFLGACLVRPDTVVVLFAFVIAAFVLHRRRLQVVTAFLLTALLSLALASDHIGWWPHFWFSNVAMQPNMTGFRPDFDPAFYVAGVVVGLAMSLLEHTWLALGTLLVLVARLLLPARRPIPSDIAMIMLAMVLAVAGKFAMFPLPNDRVYAVHLWLFALGVIALWRHEPVDDSEGDFEAVVPPTDPSVAKRIAPLSNGAMAETSWQ